MRILLVDDHALIREALSLGLRFFGHDVAEAANGNAALQHMERGLPDVLVTDLDMPGMNGRDLIKATRRAYPRLPIVAMSAAGVEHFASMPEIDNRCKLQKPFSADQLIGAIDHARSAA